MTTRLTQVLLVLAVLCTASGVPAQTPAPDDYRLITRVPRAELDHWLKEEVARSGGDIDRQRYHFVLGFSTGHYGSDPVQAIAMRRLGFSLLNNTMAVGDRVTPVAWEMRVWETGKPITLTADPKTRAAFVDAVPYAPMEASRGGHDTERALFETLTQAVPADQAKSTIVLLLTNTNQSQGPTGSRAELFGANNRRLAEAIRSRGCRSPVRQSFTAETKSSKLNVDVTALFPQKLAPLPGAPTTARYPTFAADTWQPPADRPGDGDALPNAQAAATTQPATQPATRPAPAPAPVPEPEKKGFPWPLVILVLIIIAIAAWLLTRKSPQEPAPAEATAAKGKPIPGSIRATLGAAPNSRTVNLAPLTTVSRWTLVREGDGPPTLSDAEEPPGTRLARLSFDEKRRLVLEAEQDVLFQQVTGVKADAGNPRRLALAPGDHLVCRVASSVSAGQPARVEVVYQERAG